MGKIARNRRLFAESGEGCRIAFSEDGSASVEFALIAAPFLALLLAIFETALLFLTQQALQTGTAQAARLIMTGQAQTQNMTAAQFKQLVCNDSTTLINCGSLYVNVQKFATFSSISTLNPVQNGAFNPALLNYNVGGAGDIELVQVFYEWPIYVGPLGFNLSNMNGNIHLLVATAAFRNEP
jgi:Flp pilus assembly protein TadG